MLEADRETDRSDTNFLGARFDIHAMDAAANLTALPEDRLYSGPVNRNSPLLSEPSLRLEDRLDPERQDSLRNRFQNQM
jgi:hypothetical protein